MMSALSNNSTTSNRTDQSFSGLNRPNQTELQVRMVCLWLIIVVGLIGNSFIVAVIRIFQRMRTTTNYLLVNVAVADITTLLFTSIHLLVPIKASFPTGALGSFLCKFIYTNNITMVTLLVIALTLTLLAVERYHAMVKPLLTSRRITTSKIAYFITGLWVVSIAMVTPLFVSLDHRPSSKSLCSPGNSHDEMRVYVTFLVVALTLLPFLTIAFCYSRIICGLYCTKTICSRSRGVNGQRSMKEKKRLLILLVVLTGVFFVAFLPYGVVMILQFNRMTSKSVAGFPNFSRLRSGTQYLTLLNCSLNPFIYAIPSTNYRCCLKYFVKRIFCQDTTKELETLELRDTSIRNDIELKLVNKPRRYINGYCFECQKPKNPADPC